MESLANLLQPIEHKGCSLLGVIVASIEPWPKALVVGLWRSVHACQEASQNCPALAERLDTFIDQAELSSEYSAQVVARLECWIVVRHAREQPLDRFKRHPGGAKHFNPPHGFLFRRA
jgi:hypothetical protein